MRLTILDNGHRRRAKLFLAATSRMSRVDSVDIVKMLLYRPDFLARPLLELTTRAMRGPSYWTAGEREYLAMRTARSHRCPFCVAAHTELTRIAGHGEIDPDDPASARTELTAVLEFFDTLAVPDVPRGAVEEALRVRLVWNIVNRLANAFGFVLREGQLHSGTRALHRFGYRLPGFLLAGGAPIGEAADPVDNLRHAVFDGPGRTDRALREAAGSGAALPEPWSSYTALVRDASYRITDADIDRLRAAGQSEDEIFEMTGAAAIGAALAEFQRGIEAVRASR
jgi:AhpD family alkylhydroperoxidase